MSPQNAAGPSQPSPADRTAFKIAQQAFANGWIDIADLDSVHNRVARQAESAPALAPKKSGAPNRANNGWRFAGGLVFGAVLLAFVINLLVWGIIAVTEGPPYFWPVWMLIPLTIVGGGWAMLRWNLREDRG